MSKENKYNIDDKYISEINRIAQKAYKVILPEIIDNKIFNSMRKKIMCRLMLSTLIIKDCIEQNMPDLQYQPQYIKEVSEKVLDIAMKALKFIDTNEANYEA